MCDFPKVTVLLAAHNRLDLLKESLASALNQDFNSFEVLVVDDGSDETTCDWLDQEASRNKNLRILHQKNYGVAAARQNGVREARGQFICILDSDDRLVSDALSNVFAVFIKNPEVDLVYCNNRQWMGGNKVQASQYPCFNSKEAMIRSIFLRPRVPFKHSGTIFKKDVALEIGGYTTKLPLKIDIDFFLKFLINGRKLFLVEDNLVEFLMHKDSISAQRLLGIKVWWYLIDHYGPPSPFKRLLYKTVRGFSELLKLAYLKLRIKRFISW